MRRITRREFVGGTAAVAGAGLLSTIGGPLVTSAAAYGDPGVAAIPRRPFGRTGVDVTIVCVGGGSRFYEPVKDDETGAELVRRAIDGGIGLVETSANYGPEGSSEVRIGLAMKTHRAKVFLETKVDARDYDGAMREMERSLNRLQTDRIDLVLHHNILSIAEIAAVLRPSGAERAIRQMVTEGSCACAVSPTTCRPSFRTRSRIEPRDQVPINATKTPDFGAECCRRRVRRGSPSSP